MTTAALTKEELDIHMPDCMPIPVSARVLVDDLITNTQELLRKHDINWRHTNVSVLQRGNKLSINIIVEGIAATQRDKAEAVLRQQLCLSPQLTHPHSGNF